MNPLVSIIIPAYNAAPWLKESLDSASHSTYRPLEIIVVDDGSTDDSYAIAQDYARQCPLCRVLRQPNAGVSAARNHAIREAKGKYILPLDADDIISTTYVEHAVEVMEQDCHVRVCSAQARMFGAVNKAWNMPPFSYELLARRNFIPVTSLFRRADWERVGGFCEEDICREDWDFWLLLFELGGTFHRLDEVGLYYRVHPHSRRFKAKKHKRAIIDSINRRHSAYMQLHLGGYLHYHRSWSKRLNCFYSVKQIGEWNHWQEGEVIFSGRNTLRRYHDTVIKQFKTPSWWRGLLYGTYFFSKARRSYIYANRLKGLTPTPLAYREIYYMGALRQSYYACQLFPGAHTFNELIGNPTFPHRDAILQSIGRMIAKLHRLGAYHADLSGGNILFNEDGSRVMVIDLNRIHWREHLSQQIRWKNFERLNIDRKALAVMVAAYTEDTKDSYEVALDYVLTHRWRKHVRQHITHLD